MNRRKKIKLYPLEHFTKIRKTADDYTGKQKQNHLRYDIGIEQRRARDCLNANLEYACHPRLVIDLLYILRGLLMRFGDQMHHEIDCKSLRRKGKPSECDCGYHWIKMRLFRFKGNPDEQ